MSYDKDNAFSTNNFLRVIITKIKPLSQSRRKQLLDMLPRILVVDDRPENLYAMKAILRKLDAEVVCVPSGEEALKLSLENEFCLAIVDVQMPQMDGYELVELIRSNANTSALPVIFVSAIYSDEYHYRKGYDAGAVDFLSKPVNTDILLSKVKVFIQLWQQKLELQNLINNLQDWNHYLEDTVRERTETLKADNAALTSQVAFQNEVFATAATELDGALTALRYSISRLKGAAKNPSSEPEPLQKILAAEKQINGITARLADAAKIGAGLPNLSRKPAFLQEIVAAVCNEDCHALLDEHNATIAVENLNELPPLQLDAHLIRLAFRHILLHALQKTQQGGSVKISADPLPPGTLPQDDRETIRVNFAFQGAGPEYQQWITALFKPPAIATANNGERNDSLTDTALGLLLARTVVEAHAGHLWAEAYDTPGAGQAEIIFHVLLPLG